jgi:hypothetical protein
MLGISVKHDPRGTVSSEAIKKFFLPLSMMFLLNILPKIIKLGECEFALNSILDDLQPDPFPIG